MTIFQTAAGSTPAPMRSVLIVDDYPAVLAWAARAFSRAGWTVLTANDGNEALQLWQGASDAGQAPDLLVTDLELPDIDGPSLARSLRERDPRLFVIALTGHPNRDAGWSGTLLDRTAFFQKPIMAADLLSAANALTVRDARGCGEECPVEPVAGAGAGVGVGRR